MNDIARVLRGYPVKAMRCVSERHEFAHKMSRATPHFGVTFNNTPKAIDLDYTFRAETLPERIVEYREHLHSQGLDMDRARVG